jgi:hypothetical protein
MRSDSIKAGSRERSSSPWRSLLGGCLGAADCGAGAGDQGRKKVRPRSSGVGRRLSFTDLSGAADEDLSVSLVGSNLHVFTVAELRAATREFASDNFLGEGGFGPVYKGFVDKPGLKAQAIAVKLWDPEGAQGHKEWLVRPRSTCPHQSIDLCVYNSNRPIVVVCGCGSKLFMEEFPIIPENLTLGLGGFQAYSRRVTFVVNQQAR